jgi:hypothetical protein
MVEIAVVGAGEVTWWKDLWFPGTVPTASSSGEETGSGSEAGEANPRTEVQTPGRVDPVEPPGAEDMVVLPPSADTLVLALDDLADAVAGAVRAYRSSVAGYQARWRTCSDLQAAYVNVDEAFFEYTANGMARLETDLDQERMARHDSLSLDVRRIENSFAASGCPRP